MVVPTNLLFLNDNGITFKHVVLIFLENLMVDNDH